VCGSANKEDRVDQIYMKYIKQLDSLRAIAVLLVIITHWFPEGHPLNTYTSFFNGVDIFFTLSGFLITGILLENREQIAVAGTSKWSVFKNFYARRTLRIFPIYYLAITALFILGPKTATDIRESFLYFVTYTSNFYFYKNGWDGMLSHLWSLAVEEQFYLLWPWVIILANKKYLPWIMLAAIAIGIGGQVTIGDVVTFSCFDGFGVGALLAWLLHYRSPLLEKIYYPSLWIAGLCFALQALRVFSESTVVLVPSRTLTAICTFVLINSVLLRKGEKSMHSTYILQNRWLVEMGKISYGIYLYHLMIPHFSSKALTFLNNRLPFGLATNSIYLVAAENFFILLVVSYASWRLIEQPVLRYKDRFRYTQPAKPMEENTVRVIKAEELAKDV
jgi:peptidoglycan/LPS O-acetylase OafA/YrhL